MTTFGPSDAYNAALGVAQEARLHIKTAVDHVLANEQADDKARSLWILTCTLGTLAYDVSAAALQLLEVSNYRPAKILSRSLMGYAATLNFYMRDPDRALRDVTIEAPKWLRKFIRPASRLDQSNSALWPFVAAFLSDDMKTQNLNSKEMMEASFGDIEESRREQLLEYYYYSEYAIGSALSHGNPGAICDVFSDLKGEARSHHWASRLHPSVVALSIARDCTYFVRSLSLVLSDTSHYERIKERLDQAIAAGSKPPGES